MSRKKQTQNDMVLRHLRRGPLTRFEAARRYGVIRLAACIYDLRKAGYSIESKPITVRDTRGRAHDTVQYRLRSPVPVQLSPRGRDVVPVPVPQPSLCARLSWWLRVLTNDLRSYLFAGRKHG